MSLFRKNIEPRCAYCEKGTQFNETQVACVKRAWWMPHITVPLSATTPSSVCRPAL